MKRLVGFVLAAMFTLVLSACVTNSTEYNLQGLDDPLYTYVDTEPDYLNGVSVEKKDTQSNGSTVTTTVDEDFVPTFRIDDDAVDLSTPGTYTVTYVLLDRTTSPPSGLASQERTLIVRDPFDMVLDLEWPQGVPFDPLLMETFDPDNSDERSSLVVDLSGNPIEDVQVEGDVDVDALDEYVLTYTAVFPEDDVSRSKTITITVIERAATGNPPVLNGVVDVSFATGENPDGIPGITASDVEDGDLTSAITSDFDSIDFNVADTYTVTYQVTDSDGNTTTATATVTVYVNTDPIITTATELELYQGDTAALAAFYLQVSATDAEDGDLTDSLEFNIDDTWQIEVPGTYDLDIVVTDSDGATITESVTITVLQDNAPVLVVDENIEINIGDVLSASDFVSATDDKDGDLTDQIEITGNVNTDLPGSYVVTITVTDSYGNEVSSEQTVYVVGDLSLQQYLEQILTYLSEEDYTTEEINSFVDDSLPQEMIDFRSTAQSGTGSYSVDSIYTSVEVFGIYWVTFTLDDGATPTSLSLFVSDTTYINERSVFLLEDITIDGLVQGYMEILMFAALDPASSFYTLEQMNTVLNNTIPQGLLDFYQQYQNEEMSVEDYSLTKDEGSENHYTLNITYNEVNSLAFHIYGTIDNGVVTIEFYTPGDQAMYPSVAEITTVFEAFLAAYHDSAVSDADLATYVLNGVPQELLDLREGVLLGFATVSLVSITEVPDTPGDFHVELNLNDGMMNFPFDFTIYTMKDNNTVTFGFHTDSTDPSLTAPTEAELQAAIQSFLDAMADPTYSEVDLQLLLFNLEIPQALLDLRPGVLDGTITLTITSVLSSLENPNLFDVELEYNDGMMTLPLFFLVSAFVEEGIVYFSFVPEVVDPGFTAPTEAELQAAIQSFLDAMANPAVSDVDLQAMVIAGIIPQALLDLRPGVLDGTITLTITSVLVSLDDPYLFDVELQYNDGMMTMPLFFLVSAFVEEEFVYFGFVPEFVEPILTAPTEAELQAAIQAFLDAMADPSYSEVDLQLLLFNLEIPQELLDLRPGVLDGTITLTITSVMTSLENPNLFDVELEYNDGMMTLPLFFLVDAFVEEGFVYFSFLSDHLDPNLQPVLDAVLAFIIEYEVGMLSNADLNLLVNNTIPQDLLDLRPSVIDSTLFLLNFMISETDTEGFYTLTLTIDDPFSQYDVFYTIQGFVVDGVGSFEFVSNPTT